MLWLEAGAETELQVAVVVSRPGFYHLDNLQFRAKQLVSGWSSHHDDYCDCLQDICDMTSLDQSADLFLPLDISFSVKQQQ